MQSENPNNAEVCDQPTQSGEADAGKTQRYVEILSQGEEHFRLLVEGVKDYAIFMLDPEGHVASWNTGAERIFCYSEVEAMHLHFSRFFTGEDVKRSLPEQELQGATIEGQVKEENWHVRRDGTRFWGSGVATALFDEHGSLRGFAKIVRDATERRQAEQSLRESEERFRLLIEGVKDHAIYMLDPEGRIISWNSGAERFHSYWGEEIIGQHISCLFPIEDIECGKPQQQLQVAASKGRFEEEGWRTRKDGTGFWAEVIITALYDDAGVVRGFSQVLRDITERRQTEEQLFYNAFYDGNGFAARYRTP